MSELTTSIEKQVQRIINNVRDSVAKDGLIALKRVLDGSGFAKSEYLKDYKVNAHTTKESVIFEIIIELEAFEDQDEIPKTTEDANQAVDIQREKTIQETYTILSRGGFSNVARLHDKRERVGSILKPTRSILRPTRSIRSAFKGTAQRKLGHVIANSAQRGEDKEDVPMSSLPLPRDMYVNAEGKLSVKFKKQTTIDKSGAMHYPKGSYQGISKKFIEEIKKIVANSFIPELTNLIEKSYA